MFYVTIEDPEGGDLYEHKGELLHTPSVDWFFDISQNTIFCTENYGSSYLYDLETDGLKELPFTYYGYPMIGQYIVYCDFDDDYAPDAIKAYDFLSEKEYTLQDISELTNPYMSAEIHSTSDKIYLCLEDRKEKTLDMYEVTISNGKVELELVITLKTVEE